MSGGWDPKGAEPPPTSPTRQDLALCCSPSPSLGEVGGLQLIVRLQMRDGQTWDPQLQKLRPSCVGLTQGPGSLAFAAGPGRAQGRGHLAGPASHFPHPQVALDVVEELCAEMALTRPEAFDEYVIFVVTNRGERPEDEASCAHAPPSRL